MRSGRGGTPCQRQAYSHHQPDQNIIDENDKERDLVDIILETIDRFSWRIGQRGCAGSLENIAKQILAKQRGNICKDWDIGVIETPTADHTSQPRRKHKSNDRPDSKLECRVTGEHVEESFDDQRRLKAADWSGLKVATPGPQTTAYLLLRLYRRGFQTVHTPFDEILRHPSEKPSLIERFVRTFIPEKVVEVLLLPVYHWLIRSRVGEPWDYGLPVPKQELVQSEGQAVSMQRWRERVLRSSGSVTLSGSTPATLSRAGTHVPLVFWTR